MPLFLYALALLVSTAALAQPSLEVDALAEDDAESATLSDELEELRAAEDAALDQATEAKADVSAAVRGLGFAHPLKLRLHGDSTEPELTVEGAFTLDRVVDPSTFDISLVRAQYDIPVEMQPMVVDYIQFFQGSGRKWFRRWMSRSTRYLPVMHRILEERGVPKDTVYLAMIESGFSMSAYSRARAAGPWQFIPSTGKMFGLKQDFWVDERRDPIKATHAAARYLSQLKGQFGHWYLAWAGYNAGGGKVRRTVDRQRTSDFWRLTELPGFAKETKHYVPKLIACALVAKHPEAFGFNPGEFDYLEPFDFEEVKLHEATDLEVVARAAEVSVEELRDLNPELTRWCTPPASSRTPYVLRVPKGRSEKFAANFAAIPASERLTFKVHTVARGDTLSAIAQRYQSAAEAIMRMNGLRSARSLKVRSQLVIPVPRSGATAALDRHVAQARRSGMRAARAEEEIPAGTPTKKQPPVKSEVLGGKTRVTYAVQSGDSLWSLSQRFDCSVEALREWNGIGKKRAPLREGAHLVIWPGPQAVASK